MISSLVNAKIKNIIKLRKASNSKKQDLFCVEGDAEIEFARKGGLDIVEIFYCNDFDSKISLANFKNTELTEVSRSVFEKISYRENPAGFLALVRRRDLSLDSIELKKNPLLIIAEGIEKPGNLGAIVRTAEAAGVDAVILNNSQIDLYNPNVIRSSIGTIFTVPVVTASIEDTFKWLSQNKITTFATSKAGKKNYNKFQYKKPTAFVMGSEHAGLSEAWKKQADEFIKIPMLGQTSSLNLSVSTAILVFEALRQRGF